MDKSDYAFQLLRKYKPTSIFDMSLVTASIRPSGASYREDLISRKPHKNPSELIDNLLADNNGYLVYQEDIIKFLQEICGLSGSEADTVRRGIAKKKMSILEEMMPRIMEGYCLKSDKPREQAEAEARDFLKIIEDASSYMFGYNHSVAYCLIGYLCAYLRYYHPYEFITCYLNNAANEDDVKSGTELAEFYGIRISPPKYGSSKDGYYFNAEERIISKGLASVRYLSSKLATELYGIYSDENPSTFIDLLLASKSTSMDARQLDILIKAGFFDAFGNQRELFRIRDVFNFFKQGTAKSIKKAVVGDSPVKEIIETYTTSKKKDGSEALSYTFKSPEDVICCMNDCEKYIKSLGLDDLDMRVKIQNSLDVLGYVDVVTNKESDRRRLLITDVFPLKGEGEAIWAYRVGTRSLGSGKTAKISIRREVFDAAPLKTGDIIYAAELWKNKKGYWYLQKYNLE